MNQALLIFKIKAFATHLGVSLTIALISLYLVFMIWHPSPLAQAVGVTQIFLMMLAIDAILGPVLTFLVANPNKKSLKFDLAVIVFLQLGAYFYGMYNISLNRPVYIAFDAKRFELVQASDIPKESLAKASDNYKSLSYGAPKWVAVIPFSDATEQSKRVFDELTYGIAPSMQPNLYEPLNRQWTIIEQKSMPLSRLNDYNDKNQVAKTLNAYNNNLSWLPLKAFSQDMVILIDKENDKVVDIVDLRPW